MLRPALLACALAAAAAALAGCERASPYVGTWRAAGADSLDMRYSLLADGTVRIVQRGGAAPEAFEGRYEVVGDSALALRWPDGRAPDARFGIALRGDTLRLRNATNGMETAWVRL